MWQVCFHANTAHDVRVNSMMHHCAEHTSTTTHPCLGEGMQFGAMCIRTQRIVSVGGPSEIDSGSVHYIWLQSGLSIGSHRSVVIDKVWFTNWVRQNLKKIKFCMHEEVNTDIDTLLAIRLTPYTTSDVQWTVSTLWEVLIMIEEL